MHQNIKYTSTNIYIYNKNKTNPNTIYTIRNTKTTKYTKTNFERTNMQTQNTT